MAIEDRAFDAEVLANQLAAHLGAVDVPQAPLLELLGINVFPGQTMYDTVTGEIVEVIDAGVQSVAGA